MYLSKASGLMPDSCTSAAWVVNPADAKCCSTMSRSEPLASRRNPSRTWGSLRLCRGALRTRTEPPPSVSFESRTMNLSEAAIGRFPLKTICANPDSLLVS